MTISEAMNAKLNGQIAYEQGAAQIYLSMSCMFDGMGLKVLAAFFRRQCDEERIHAMKMVDYILEVDGKVKLAAIPQPKHEWSGIQATCEAALELEKVNTQQINELVALAEKENDYATRSFLQWFVDEQVEEVATMSHLVDLTRLAGDQLLLLEDHVDKLNAKVSAPGAAAG